MRGDPPRTVPVAGSTLPSTPHARGSTYGVPCNRASFSVYPACAGIHLIFLVYPLFLLRLPRMRGDPPLLFPHRSAEEWSTPHARGSTPCLGCKRHAHRVYPACAGIHPEKPH